MADHINKWAQFETEASPYTLKDLGREAFFLIPAHKLEMRIGDHTVRDVLHEFIFQEFGDFTTSMVAQYGVWRNGKGEPTYDACVQYWIAFVGPERIPTLLAKLAELCTMIVEECLYFRAGQYACLVYPKK